MNPALPPAALKAIAAADDSLSYVERLLDTLDIPVDADTIATATRTLTRALPCLPQPGHGDTLLRWRMLAAIAARDLSLAKLYEAHAAAAAILAELGSAKPRRGTVWAVWTAQMPGADVRIVNRDGDRVRLAGSKAWCSGAAFATDALVTGIDDEGRQWLAAVDLSQPGVEAVAGQWHAAGLAATGSFEVRFEDVPARVVGGPNAYRDRPGFWFGVAGVAACWYGAAAALARHLAQSATYGDDPHRRAQLDTADAALSAARALLRETAREIDLAPTADATASALSVRSAVENAVDAVTRATARGLGAMPFCRDRWFAQMAADLPAFVRQSHAEHDLATLGATLATEQAAAERHVWNL
jgi:hypothetical protein